MGEIVNFRQRAGIAEDYPTALARLTAAGMEQGAAVICGKILEEMSKLSMPQPILRGWHLGGFLLLWDLPHVSFAIEAPGPDGRTWSFHHHDKKAVLKPCYELKFQYRGDNAAIARAVKEGLSPDYDPKAAG